MTPKPNVRTRSPKPRERSPEKEKPEREKSSGRETRRAPATPPLARARELSGLALGVVSLAALLGMFSFTKPTNWTGPVGRFLADLLLGAVGIGAYPIVIGLLGLSILWLMDRRFVPRPIVALSLSGVYLSLLLLVALFGPSSLQLHPPAGALGVLFAGKLVSLFSVPGSTILVLALLLGCLAIVADFELRRLVEWLGKSGRFLASPVVAGVEAAQEVWREAREAHELSRAESAALREERRKQRLEALYDQDEDEELADEDDAPEDEPAPAPKIAERPAPPLEEKPKNRRKPLPTSAPSEEKPAPVIKAREAAPAAPAPEPEPARPSQEAISAAISSLTASVLASKAAAATAAASAAPVLASLPVAEPVAPVPSAPAKAAPASDPDDLDEIPAVVAPKPSPKASKAAPAKAPAPEPAPKAAPASSAAPTIVEPKLRPKPVIPEHNPQQAEDKEYQLPPLSFLDYKPPTGFVLDHHALTANARKLEQKLLDYHVPGSVAEIHPGPVITTYEFAPAPGIKISKISGLSDDLAMALEAERVRIIAPIPGKSVVGIELPNVTRETVYLKEILADNAFQKSGSKLALGIGKDVSGAPKVADLAKMPHLLVAGATGSGKSVAINTFICSILFNASPKEVRFIMVDPKMLELSIYEGIPHLLLPVVTDMKKAALALRWAVDEMERRYQLLAEAGVRNISNYNRKIELKREEAESRKKARREAAFADDLPPPPIPDGEADAPLDAQELALPFPDERIPDALPYIVVIIDELADLMMVASREVETSIARLAQMARAAGIHLILATQRPSVDVITGLIKANFPSRISFQVASRIDSRTILDQQGAENLLGMGDMLMMERGKVQRFHGALVSEEEIHEIVNFLKQQGTPQYDESILAPRDDDEDGAGKDEDDDPKDALYDQALAIVSEMEKVSTSMLQRKMRIGYNRAARLIDIMEREGVVGPGDGAKPREVLIRPI